MKTSDAGRRAIAQREGVSGRWLLVAAGLVLLNDALLTSAYGLLPTDFIEGDYNWQGKLLALVATLIVTRVSAFGWSDAGLTVRQAPNSLRPAALVALAYMALFLGLAAIFPNEPASRERVAFQLTMPGLAKATARSGLELGGRAIVRAFWTRARIWLLERTLSLGPGRHATDGRSFPYRGLAGPAHTESATAHCPSQLRERDYAAHLIRGCRGRLRFANSS